jgi:hypothetical protein
MGVTIPVMQVNLKATWQDIKFILNLKMTKREIEGHAISSIHIINRVGDAAHERREEKKSKSKRRGW